MKFHLVENWQNAWKWFSVQCMAAALIIQPAWDAIPQNMKDSLPAGSLKYITYTLLAAGIIGRMKRQTPVSLDKS